jgi:hypothetical protein
MVQDDVAPIEALPSRSALLHEDRSRSSVRAAHASIN